MPSDPPSEPSPARDEPQECAPCAGEAEAAPAEAAYEASVRPEYLLPPASDVPRPKEQRGSHAWHGTKVGLSQQLCAHGPGCRNIQKCRNMHDLDAFLAARPKDLDTLACPFFATLADCPYGVNCRFAGTHLEASIRQARARHDPPDAQPAPKAVGEAQKFAHPDMLNVLTSATLQEARKGRYSKPATASQVAEANARRERAGPGCRVFADVLRPGALVLAPMCTVGTVPFRRLCVEYGCDATVSEMVVMRSLMQGAMKELVKVRRHASERVFGVQVAGRGRELELAVDLLAQNTDIDFVDLNAACPQDLATLTKCGAALLTHPKAFADSARILADATRKYTGLFATCKVRAGDLFGNWNGKAIAQAAAGTGLSALSMHGRTARQRYSRPADWAFLAGVKQALGAPASGDGGSGDGGGGGAMLLGGNGDIFQPEDLAEANHAPLNYYLIARGALVKPWIFRELREGRRWDPSSAERLAMLRRFASYCLEYYGTDGYGVENARRQFLENWNFMSRYIPPALLDRPQALNERVPRYRGRDDLETLLGSQDIEDWVRLSEMFFGPVPDSFVFMPKHRSKGYVERDQTSEQQG